MDEGYEDLNMHHLRPEWYRDVPADWQRRVMNVEPRLRIIQHPASRHYLVVMQQSATEKVSHMERFGTNPDGTHSEEYLYRWLPIRWHPSQAGIEYFVSHLQESQQRIEREIGDFSPAKVETYLAKRHERMKQEMKAAGDAKIEEAAKETMANVGTQKVQSFEGIEPGKATVRSKPLTDDQRRDTKLILGVN